MLGHYRAMIGPPAKRHLKGNLLTCDLRLSAILGVNLSNSATSKYNQITQISLFLMVLL